MKLWVDGQKVVLPEDELDDLYENEGQEGIIYHYGDYAYKIYKPYCSKYRLSEDECQKMLDIPTRNVLLPRGIIYDERKRFVGYYTEFIERKPIYHILNMKLKDFSFQVGDVYDDLQLLSQRDIAVHDMNLSNFCYHDGFYFVDPGSYIFVDSFCPNILYSFNKDEFTKFLVLDVFSRSLKMTHQNGRLLQKHFKSFEYLPLEEYQNDTVKTYVKRLTNIS